MYNLLFIQLCRLRLFTHKSETVFSQSTSLGFQKTCFNVLQKYLGTVGVLLFPQIIRMQCSKIEILNIKEFLIIYMSNHPSNLPSYFANVVFE